MATDAIVVEHAEHVLLGSDMTTIVQLAPLQPGRSYVISAIGSIFIGNSVVTLELEAFDATHTVRLQYPPDALEASFALALGTSLPPDDELFTVAKLSGRTHPFHGTTADATASIQTAKLVVLAVDSITVQAG